MAYTKLQIEMCKNDTYIIDVVLDLTTYRNVIYQRTLIIETKKQKKKLLFSTIDSISALLF